MIFYIPIQLAPQTVLSWFIKEPGIVNQGVPNFRILFSTYILLGFMLMVITMMQAMGKASKAPQQIYRLSHTHHTPMFVPTPHGESAQSTAREPQRTP